MLYAIPIGILVGILLGGSLRGLAELRFRYPLVVLAGMLVQVVLFEESVAAAVGDLGAALYVGSTAMVAAAIVANARIPGIPIVAVGAALNLLVIVANGGYMPAGADAYQAAAVATATGYSNTRVIAEPVLAPLSDVIVLPPGLPLWNVISVGDLLIAAGTAATIGFAMRGRTGARPADSARAT